MISRTFIPQRLGYARMAELIAFEDFLKLDLRIGRIEAAEDFPKARRPSYRLTIDFGSLGVRRSEFGPDELKRSFERDGGPACAC